MNILLDSTKSSLTSACLAATICLSCSIMESADGQSTEVRAVTFDLKSITGQLQLLDEQRMSIRQADGSTLNTDPGEVAFMEFSDTIKNNAPDGKLSNGLLQLVDGTRYTGWPDFDVADGRFIWLNWWSGTIQPEIDTIVFFAKEGDRIESPSPDETEDLLLLSNGDRLSGLVLEITNTVEIERIDATVASVPVERVDSLSLVNPIIEESGVRAWLTRGDEVVIDSYRFDVGTGLRIPGREPLMPNYLYAIAFDAERIRPLAEQTSRSLGLPGSDRYLVPKPRVGTGAWPLDAPPIDLQGPMRVEWVLPREGMGLTTTAVIPSRSRRHGDFELVFFDGDREVRTFRMNESSPVVDITIPLESRRLSVEIREGSVGPVQNHVRLERALLVDPGTS